MVEAPFTPRSAFAGLLRDHGAAGAGVSVADRDGVTLFSLLALRGDRPRDLPDGPTRVQAGRLAFLGVGPGRWLALAEGNEADTAAELASILGPDVAVIDQSSALGVLRLSGPRLRDALAKGVTIDLHPEVFRVNDAATTSIAHIGATLWRLDDAADGAPVIEIAVPRSLAASFWHWLASGSAEYGLVVGDGV